MNENHGRRIMATYAEIQHYIKKKYGYTPITCWIAHAKELSGIPVRKSHRRTGQRVNPCPKNKLSHIQNAFEQHGMMKYGK
jgi:hypothetical protein